MNLQITQSEWIIMERLWEDPPKTLMGLKRELEQETGWAKSTVATMLTRMLDKGIIRYETDGKTKQFYPAVTRQEVTMAETDSMLARLYHGSVGMMVSTLVDNKKLTRQEIEELLNILQEAGEQ